VVLQIQDDGAGLDPEMLRRAAVQGGFVSEADAGQLDDADLHSLILMPGFTTAQQVSEISGRGVGMDIVRSAVTSSRAPSPSLAARPWRDLHDAFAADLAVARVLLVRAHGEVFALPLSTVRQIRLVEPQDIQTLGQDAVVRTEDKILPLLRLGNVLHLKNPPEDVGSRPPMVVLDAGEQRFGLLVDALIENREVVVKSLGDHLRRISGVTGATLMGDGSVVLILNPAEFLEGAKKQEATHKALIHAPAAARRAWKILIVDDSFSVRRVLSNLVRQAGWEPLEAKDGLEALEVLHGSAVPPELVLLDIEMPRMDGYELISSLRSQPAYRELPVVVLTSRAGSKHRDKALQVGASEYLIKPFQDEILAGYGSPTRAAGAAELGSMSDSVRILVVDDSPFVCRFLTTQLQTAPGFEVIGMALTGARAIELTRELRPDVVTLALQMPDMNGLDVLERIMQECPTPSSLSAECRAVRLT
jgi:chemosensory pili system protein ChpA (sensor histidine kinase/response regulator)